MSSADGFNLTPQRRDRLHAAIAAAPGNEIVSVKAADLRACLVVAEAVMQARELVGENARLRETIEARAKLIAAYPLVSDRLIAVQGANAALQNRIELAMSILVGKAPT
jgi:hypothetical protein